MKAFNKLPVLPFLWLLMGQKFVLIGMVRSTVLLIVDHRIGFSASMGPLTIYG